MAKEILRSDIPKVKSLTLTVLGTDEFAELSRMGGLTNHTYKVTLKNGEAFVVRIPGEGTEELIVRSDEKKSTALACDIGIDAQLLYFGQDGSKVTRFIDNAVTMSAESLKDPIRISQVADIFKTLHNCKKNTDVPFEVFDMAAGYEKIIAEKSVAMFEDFDLIKAEVFKIKSEIDDLCNPEKVPCHNDPLCENWVVGGDKMFLIDWEYAGMNDGMWDLADVSIEASFGPEEDRLLLKEYLGKAPDLLVEKHFLASKCYVDFLWTLWAKARVPYDGQPMEDWAAQRYERLKGFIAQYKKL